MGSNTLHLKTFFEHKTILPFIIGPEFLEEYQQCAIKDPDWHLLAMSHLLSSYGCLMEPSNHIPNSCNFPYSYVENYTRFAFSFLKPCWLYKIDVNQFNIDHVSVHCGWQTCNNVLPSSWLDSVHQKLFTEPRIHDNKLNSKSNWNICLGLSIFIDFTFVIVLLMFLHVRCIDNIPTIYCWWFWQSSHLGLT